MKYEAHVEVSLKKGHSDPEGETTKNSLIELGYKLTSVKVSKVYQLVLEAESFHEAQSEIEEICRRLLANPVKDNYDFRIEEKK